MLQLGYNFLTEQSITAELTETGHLCCVGGTGSGKSVATLYFLYQLLKNYSTELSVADFKKLGDYAGIAEKFAEFEEVKELIEDFYTEFEEQYHPKTGQGLILIDGQELKALQIPYISDKGKLKALLVRLANECPRH